MKAMRKTVVDIIETSKTQLSKTTNKPKKERLTKEIIKLKSKFVIAELLKNDSVVSVSDKDDVVEAKAGDYKITHKHHQTGKVTVNVVDSERFKTQFVEVK